MMRLSILKTHWTPEEAQTVLTFLDELRDTLWQNYGNDIVEHARQEYVTSREEEHEGDKQDDVIYF
jgi:hypothetical protein